MSHRPGSRPRLNRRNFLRGAAGVSVALPFLESLPERSAWAAGEEPVFGLFICAVGGVVTPSFFPAELGPLTAEGLGAAGRATSRLSAHAQNLLFLRGVRWPQLPTGDSHVQGLCQALTARPPSGSGTQAVATGPSADVVIASSVHPGLEPLTLYAGNHRNGFIAERLSFTASGQIRPAVYNPYLLYQELVGIATPDGMTPEGAEAAKKLVQSRNSIHDLVREELTELMGNSRLGGEDRARLEMHFDGIRDAEIKMDGMGEEMMELCSMQGIQVEKLEALKEFVYDPLGGTEEVAALHLSLVALAFACNHRRVATLQWGDGYDDTVYPVPSNERRWRFSHISHRAQSDGTVGTDPLAELAHAEIDDVRMRTLASGLDHFAARGLADRSFVLWTNHYAEGPSHSFLNVPHILWGNAGGYLKQAEHLNLGTVTNSSLLTTLINAAAQDMGAPATDFGDGTGQELAAIRA